MVRHRNDVESVVIVGEIGGDAEEQLADYLIETRFSKPVVAYIAEGQHPKKRGWVMLAQLFMEAMGRLNRR